MLQYFIVCGAENCEGYARDNINTIRTLNQFQYIDDQGRDQGMQGTTIVNGNNILFYKYSLVREKAKEIVHLLSDEELMAEAKRIKALPRRLRSASMEPVMYHDRKALEARRVNSEGKLIGNGGNNNSGEMNVPEGYDEEAALKRAIEESRKSAVKTANTDLLSLDDETFVQALDSIKKPAHLPQASSLQQIPSWSIPSNRNTGVSTTTNTTNKDPFSGGQDYSGMNRSKQMAVSVPQLSPLQNPSDKDPFADVTETFKESLTLSRAPSLSKQSPKERVPMPLPLGQTIHLAEMQTGAKPVTPGSLAPQFGYNNRSGTKPDATTMNTPNNKTSNTPTPAPDPFAD